MDWPVLSLGSAFFLATADAITKRYLAGCRPGETTLIRFGSIAVLMSPCLFMGPWPNLPVEFWELLAIAVPIEILAMWLYMKAIRASPLSHTLPYLAFTPVFNVLTGYLGLGETVSPVGFTGILLVVCGAWLLNGEKASDGSNGFLAPFKVIIREEGSRLMLITAALYSVNSVLGKALLGYAPPLFLGSFYFLLIASVAGIVFIRKGDGTWQSMRKHPWAIFFVGIFMTAMILTHFYAVTRIEVAYMIAVKRTSLLFGILYGAWLFQEKGLVRHLAAGALMIAGVFLIVG
ncbi:MAG: DMT family transporter [Desulfobulbaceae bacterium]|nr:DMT family transporter [Desulfobulbaceae bacterium]